MTEWVPSFLFVGELKLVKTIVIAFLLEQGLMVALLDDLAILQADDVIGVLDGR